ncbi:MAG: acyl transferase, partial [Chitinophagaceae bacterium]
FYTELFNHTVIMETGGMKGRRKEMIREEVHDILRKSFNVPAIHSEYGMTELLSQAYSVGDGIFKCPPWMKVLVRDEEDPLTIKRHEAGRFVSGAINIIDLANIFSCSFIATDDAGKVFPDDSFEVLGRIDNSDLRGCSLMVV